MNDLGKLLVIVGIVLVMGGAVMWKTGGQGGLGHLPGDFTMKKGNGTFYFPIGTCLLLSALLSLLAWLLRR